MGNNAAKGIFTTLILISWDISSGITGSWGSSIFFMNSHIVFHNHCINMHSYQLCKRLFSLHSDPHNVSLLFVIMVILTDVRWHLNVVSICISLMTTDLNTFFCTCLSFVCLLWNKNIYLSGPLPIFKIGLFGFM